MRKTIPFALLACCLFTAAFAQAKPRIEKAADMPRFSYKIDGKLEDLVRDEAAFRRFAEQVRRDDLSVLDGYEIADKPAHRDLLTVNPKLTPPEVIAIIQKTLDKTEDGRRFLVHPARAVAAAQAGAG